jgi:xanthine dehydrogenase YagR molybdenum-binding subunit
MAQVNWPAPERRVLLGKRLDRTEGPVKVTGAACYSYDVSLAGMIYAKVVTSPHAHAEINGLDTQAAEAFPGVKAVWKDEAKEVQYVGQIIAAVAAETEEIAREAAQLVRVTYKVLEHQVKDTDPALAVGKPSTKEEGNVAEALGKADLVSSGEYGLPIVAHCCMEAHGQVTEIRDGELYVWPSTQSVSRYSDQLGESVGIPQSKIHVNCQHMGGGFGSKFNHDKWGVIGALLSKKSGRPVKLMLERDIEMAIAGNRPSAYTKVKVGLSKDGAVTAFDAEVWGTAGMSGGVPNVIPYVFTKIPSNRLITRRIRTHQGGARAWRAPNHPQSCFITMVALDDAAAALKIDALEFFMRNAGLTDRPEVYREELQVAADLIGYKQKSHPRGDKTPGPIKRGLGISIHTWGGQGHASDCDLTINPDGSVEARLGSQDLGTGTRTCIGIVVAETLGLPLEAVKVEIGKNEYPTSGASGGSTTIGGVSVSSRQAATAALNALLEVVAPSLGTNPTALEARQGNIQEVGKPGNKISWKEACALLGPNPITKRGSNNPGESEKAGLISSGVGGVQIADVSVDNETGVVTLNEMVCVQDCGLIVDLKTAESQVYGGMIMGITYALFEEAIYDARTGRMLNADMEFYRLAGLKDMGRLKVHMMTGRSYDERGVIGLGEPPVISPGAAISNAVANALGLRVPHLPLTPDRVIATLQKGGLI